MLLLCYSVISQCEEFIGTIFTAAAFLRVTLRRAVSWTCSHPANGQKQLLIPELNETPNDRMANTDH